MKKKIALLLTGIMLLSGTVSVNAASASRYIDNRHGYLTGYVDCGWAGSPLNEKIANASARTTKSVSRVRASVSVYYTNSGQYIASETSNWQYNTNAAYTYDVEMHHFTNKETGRRDGFKNTRLTSYGAADAIQEKAYVVYTSVIN